MKTRKLLASPLLLAVALTASAFTPVPDSVAGDECVTYSPVNPDAGLDPRSPFYGVCKWVYVPPVEVIDEADRGDRVKVEISANRIVFTKSPEVPEPAINWPRFLKRWPTFNDTVLEFRYSASPPAARYSASPALTEALVWCEAQQCYLISDPESDNPFDLVCANDDQEDCEYLDWLCTFWRDTDEWACDEVEYCIFLTPAPPG